LPGRRNDWEAVVEKAAVRRWVQGDRAERQGSGDTVCRIDAERACEGSIAREGRGIRRIGFEMRVKPVDGNSFDISTNTPSRRA
jgi:hypothetical protein